MSQAEKVAGAKMDKRKVIIHSQTGMSGVSMCWH